jgi:hypothetical protein
LGGVEVISRRLQLVRRDRFRNTLSLFPVSLVVRQMSVFNNFIKLQSNMKYLDGAGA